MRFDLKFLCFLVLIASIVIFSLAGRISELETFEKNYSESFTGMNQKQACNVLETKAFAENSLIEIHLFNRCHPLG